MSQQLRKLRQGGDNILRDAVGEKAAKRKKPSFPLAWPIGQIDPERPVVLRSG